MQQKISIPTLLIKQTVKVFAIPTINTIERTINVSNKIKGLKIYFLDRKHLN